MLDSSEPDAKPHSPPSKAGYKHFTQAQLGIILRLSAENRPQTAIAQALGVNQAAISYALKRLGTDSSDLAKHHFKATSYRAARKVTGVLETGKPDERLKAAKVVLEAAGVISSANSSIQLGIQVVIGSEGQPAIQADSVAVEVLDATPQTLSPRD